MSTILEAVAHARDARTATEQGFRETLVQARQAGHSWAEIAAVAGMSRAGVRWLTDNQEQRAKDAIRRAKRKEKTP